MARSIVLRFDAQCFDCGRSLPAGTTARWFGRGRVSCCGAASPSGAGFPPVRPSSTPAPLPPLPASASPEVRRFVSDASAELAKSARDLLPPVPPANPHAPLAGSLLDKLGAELCTALECGLDSNTLARVAELVPEQRLCVRLNSGARFIVMARDASHLIRCVSESCIDRVRDVMRAAEVCS